jgi:Fe-S cluster assembly protein SufD
MSSPLTARIVEEYESAARSLPAADAHERHAAIEALRVSGLPTSRDENWKYANLRSLERQRFVPAATAAPLAGAGLPARLAGFPRYGFVDGVFATDSSAPLDASGARISPGTSSNAHRSFSADERFALLNQAFATGGVTLQVPAAGGEPARLELVFLASADSKAGACYPRVDIRLDPGASLTLIERHLSAGEQASFVASAVTIDLQPGARLEHYRLQELNPRSILFDTVSAELARESAYRLHCISTGAQAARSTLAVRLNGERAELNLAVAALGGGQQVQDAYALVEHQAPHARTEQTFRGIAAGRARVAFNGKIVVAKGARGTDSRQSLRGLLAGPEAEIDVRPQLEIYTDDVRCSHGATAGKLDDNMLFYLLSRGLTPESAQRLLKWAFLEDVVAQIALPALRRQIEERLADHLGDDTLRELL